MLTESILIHTFEQLKAEQARATEKKLMNSVEMAGYEQVNALAAICIWAGDHSSVAFFAFNKMLYHLVARCCEASILSKHEVTTVRRSENGHIFDILMFNLERHKTGSHQKPVMYPHRDEMLWDAYFGMAIHLVTDQTTGPYLFPTFQLKCVNKKNKKTESKSSSLWNHYYDMMMKLTEVYPGKNDL